MKWNKESVVGGWGEELRWSLPEVSVVQRLLLLLQLRKLAVCPCDRGLMHATPWRQSWRNQRQKWRKAQVLTSAKCPKWAVQLLKKCNPAKWSRKRFRNHMRGNVCDARDTGPVAGSASSDKILTQPWSSFSVRPEGGLWHHWTSLGEVTKKKSRCNLCSR